MRVETRIIRKDYFFFEKEDKQKIKDWLKENELNIKWLAEELGFSYKHLINALAGRKSIPEDVIGTLESIGIHFDYNEEIIE